MVNDNESFIEGTEDSYTVDLGDPVGEVEIRGGAFRALLPRVGLLALASGGSGPGAGRAETQGSAAAAHSFDGFDTDWGDPGYKAGDLNPIIPEKTRELMEAWVREYERW